MKRNHPNMETTMTIQNMNETRAATMRRVLENRPFLNQLREEDREALIQLYVKNLEKWEKSNG